MNLSKKQGRPNDKDVAVNLRVSDYVNNYILSGKDSDEAYRMTFGAAAFTPQKAQKYAKNRVVVNAILDKTTELLALTEGIDRAWILKELKFLYNNNRTDKFGQKTALSVLQMIAQMIGAMQPQQNNIQINNINGGMQLPPLEIKFVQEKNNKTIDATDAEIIEGDTDK